MVGPRDTGSGFPLRHAARSTGRMAREQRLSSPSLGIHAHRHSESEKNTH